MFFKRAALWGSGQGLEQGKEITETRKGGEINPGYCMGLELGMGQDLCWKGAAGPSLMLLAGKMLL